METLRQFIQADSDTLILKTPDSLVNRVLEIVVFPVNLANNEISKNAVTMQQIRSELAEFHQRFDPSFDEYYSYRFIKQRREF